MPDEVGPFAALFARPGRRRSLLIGPLCRRLAARRPQQQISEHHRCQETRAFSYRRVPVNQRSTTAIEWIKVGSHRMRCVKKRRNMLHDAAPHRVWVNLKTERRLSIYYLPPLSACMVLISTPFVCPSVSKVTETIMDEWQWNLGTSKS